MNKQDLITSMVEKTGLQMKEIGSALQALIVTVEDAVAKGDKVQLVGFGTFESRDRAEKQGRNPRTNDVITIPAATVPVFHAGKQFKDKVSQTK